jgi:alkylated DNA nucleotide flippase Atl1
LTARRGSTSPGARLSAFCEAVAAVVEAIPPGRVMSYGDIAEFLGCGGPRQVGAALSRDGGGLPCPCQVRGWLGFVSRGGGRVVHADGTPPPGKEHRAVPEWAAEGTPRRAPGRVDMSLARWNPSPEQTVGGR